MAHAQSNKKKNEHSKQPDDEVNAKDDSSADAKPKKQKKKGRWRRRFLWAVGLLVVLAFFVNGPIARKAIHFYLNQSLESQGMTGSVEIKGTILSGFQVHQLDYTGSEGIQKLSVNHASVDYKIMDLLDLKIDAVQLSHISAIIDTAKFKPAPPSDEPEKDWREQIKELKPIALHPEITVTHLSVTVLNDGKKMLHCKLAKLHHPAQSDAFTFEQWQVEDADGLATPEQTATLTLKEESITLDQLELLPHLGVKDIDLQWDAYDESAVSTTKGLKANAKLRFHDALLSATIGDQTSLELVSGKIESEKVLALLETFSLAPEKLDADATLTTLKLLIPTDDLSLPIPEWDIESKLALSAARFESYQTKDTTITFHQQEKKYQLTVNGTAQTAPIDLSINGEWLASPTESTNWWENTKATVSLTTQLNDEIFKLMPPLNLPEKLHIQNAKIEAKIDTQLSNGELGDIDSIIKITKLSVDQIPLPALTIESKVTPEMVIQAELQPMDKSFSAKGSYRLNEQIYNATFSTNTTTEKSPWINALASVFGSPVTLQDQLNLSWEGSGNLEKQLHNGKLLTNDLKIIQSDQAPVSLNVNAEYDLPKSVDIIELTLQQEELKVDTSLAWTGQDIAIRRATIFREDELIASIAGIVPYSQDITDSKQFFAQQRDWNLTLDTEKLDLKRLATLIPAAKDSPLKKLTGTGQATIKLTGTPKSPEINGKINAIDMNDVFDVGLDNISLNTTLETKGDLLDVRGKLTENDEQRIKLDLQLPFTPHQWLEDDNLLETIQKNTELKGSAQIKKLPLGKFKKTVPQLAKLEGLLDVNAVFEGTIAKPKYKIDFNADLPIVSLKDAGIDDIKEVGLEGFIDESMILKGELKAKLNGGSFLTDFNVDLNETTKPIFDVKLRTNYALVYRDEAIATRANADLALKGTLENATISGNIGIVESLFYKDIDLIPIGVPSSAVGAVKLPSLNTKASNKLPIPAPFDQWKLNLTVKTADPILIRGNVGKGRIDGCIKVNGTLSDPQLNGTLYANNVKAKLPFSVLSINKGKIIFKPNKGFIPTLQIRGKSQIGVHNVTLNVYGSADNPQIALSSYPALPENEIMTLLATGATNAGLANRDVATFKTLQILLLKLKQKHDRPGGNKLFRTLLSGIQDLDLKIGETNDLTGEKYASATVELHERWFLTAQLDNGRPPQTRGLIVFALRFN